MIVGLLKRLNIFIDKQNNADYNQGIQSHI